MEATVHDCNEGPEVLSFLCELRDIRKRFPHRRSKETPFLVHRFAGDAHGTRRDEQRNSLGLNK